MITDLKCIFAQTIYKQHHYGKVQKNSFKAQRRKPDG